MISDADLFVIAQINAGLRTDIDHLRKLDAQMKSLLNDARAIPGATSPAQVAEWDALMRDVETLHHHAEQIDKALLDEAPATDLKEDWKIVKETDQRIERHFVRLRDAGLTMIAPDRRQHWSDLWRTVFLHLETVRAHAAVVEAKGEMRVRYGADKVDSIAQDILKHLPANADPGQTELYAEEYRKGIEEYLANKEHFGGFLDIVKSLLLIPQETPDQIARRRMSNMRQSQ